MRILYLAPRFPFPPNRGDRLTGYHFIRVMSRRHRVTLLSFVDGSEPPDAVAALERWCERVEVVRLPRCGDRGSRRGLACSRRGPRR